MRLLISLILLTAAVASFSDGSEFAGYEKCVADLKSTYQWYRNHIPDEFWSMDRKLQHMGDGIAVIEKNLGLLKRGAPSPFLFANGTEGCLAYTAAFRSRAREFFIFGCCLLSLCGVMIITAIMILIAPGAANGRGKTPTPGPSDQPHTRPFP